MSDRWSRSKLLLAASCALALGCGDEAKDAPQGASRAPQGNKGDLFAPALDLPAGGRDTPIEEIPWQASLRTRFGGRPRHSCGGVIVHARWILTAAHCVVGIDPYDAFVVAGVTDQASERGQERSIARIIVHPEYERSSAQNDIALLELVVPFAIDETVAVVPIVTRELAALGAQDPGVEATLSGWWRVGGAFGVVPDRLQSLTLPIIEIGAARLMWQAIDPRSARVLALDERALAVGRLEGGEGFCPGGSGGPLSIELSPGAYVVAGVASWASRNCAIASHPSIYTRLSAFEDWIARQMGDDRLASEPARPALLGTNLRSDLRITEVLADPRASLDANGDGAVDDGDEFVEIENISERAYDLSGVSLVDGARERFVFPIGTWLEPGQIAVVFGDAAPPLLGARAFSADGDLGLNDAGELVALRAPGGETLASVQVRAIPIYFPDTSYAWSDEFGEYAPHNTFADHPFSPGEPNHPDLSPGHDGPLTVTEVYPMPWLLDDWNADGTADEEDAFVEIVNSSGAPIELADFVITAGARAVQLPAGTLWPGEVRVLFCGGSPWAVWRAWGEAALVFKEPFALGRSSGRIEIKRAGDDQAVVDTFRYAGGIRGLSAHRVERGQNGFEATDWGVPTPGELL